MAAKSIRDMLVGPPHPSESITLQTLAATVQEHEAYPEENPGFHAKMPGDSSPHLLGTAIQNPLPGESVLALSRRLRDGTLPPQLERQAQAYIHQYQKWSGDAVYDARNHEQIQEEIEITELPTGQMNIGGYKRVDRFPNYESEFEQLSDVIAQNPRPTSAAQVQARGPVQTAMPVINEGNEDTVLESLWKTL